MRDFSPRYWVRSAELERELVYRFVRRQFQIISHRLGHFYFEETQWNM